MTQRKKKPKGSPVLVAHPKWRNMPDILGHKKRGKMSKEEIEQLELRTDELIRSVLNGTK